MPAMSRALSGTLDAILDVISALSMASGGSLGPLEICPHVSPLTDYCTEACPGPVFGVL